MSLSQMFHGQPMYSYCLVYSMEVWAEEWSNPSCQGLQKLLAIPDMNFLYRKKFLKCVHFAKSEESQFLECF